MYISGADQVTLSAFKIELQRIIDLSLDIDPIITDYMKSRVDNIEKDNES
jgi:hypothetical protein